MISFSDGARKRYHMDEYKFCVLYYDADTRRVGIEFSNDESAEGAIKIRFRATGADVAAKSFCDYFDIGIHDTKLYDIEKDDETGLATLDLKSGKARNTKKVEK
jgi:hypothetical protein